MNWVFASEIAGCLRVSGSPMAHLERLSRRRRTWEQTLEWLDYSGIALLFWNRLKELKAESVIPAAIGERLERNLSDHRLRVAEMAEEFDSINRRLEGAGVKYASLKGFALIPEYCPDAFLRTTYDYDYLLPRESMECAEQALAEAGYIRKKDPEDHPVVYFHKTRPPRTPSSRDDLYSATFPRTVELHYLFWDADQVKIPLRFPQDPLAQLRWRTLSPAQGDLQGHSSLRRDVRFYTLCDEDDLIFQVLHAFRHILQNWCRLCSLLDVAYLLEHRASDAAFWHRFLGRLKYSRPLSDIAGVVFLLAAGVFGAAIPNLVASKTTQNLPSSLALWVERYGLDSALNNFSDNKFSLFLHREFIQDAATWRKVRRTRLFPLQRPDKAFQTTSCAVTARLAARWKQGFYAAGRLKHHLGAAMRYGLEAPLWDRARAKVRSPGDEINREV